MQPIRISIIGSGNVATHLAKALHGAGHHVVQVISRQLGNAQLLANQIGAKAHDQLLQVDPTVDLLILSVTDQAIAPIVEQLPQTQALVVHTAGSMSMEALSKFVNHGVFYPFQTFSKQKEVDFSTIPFLVEANSATNTERLKQIAAHLSQHVIEANSDQRMQLHISAVLACNFVNHLYTLANKLLCDNHLPFDLLRPLIAETTEKIDQLSPAMAQTGPAVRGDWEVIEKHVAQLANTPDIQDLYKRLSQSIHDFHSKAPSAK